MFPLALKRLYDHLDSCVTEHLPWTLVEVFRILAPVARSCPSLQADPAVRMLTFCAGHVVTPIELIARYLTPRAKLCVVFLRPLDELSIKQATFRSWM